MLFINWFRKEIYLLSTMLNKFWLCFLLRCSHLHIFLFCITSIYCHQKPFWYFWKRFFVILNTYFSVLSQFLYDLYSFTSSLTQLKYFRCPSFAVFLLPSWKDLLLSQFLCGEDFVLPRNSFIVLNSSASIGVLSTLLGQYISSHQWSSNLVENIFGSLRIGGTYQPLNIYIKFLK